MREAEESVDLGIKTAPLGSYATTRGGNSHTFSVTHRVPSVTAARVMSAEGDGKRSGLQKKKKKERRGRL